jgi:heptosyltransferase-2
VARARKVLVGSGAGDSGYLAVAPGASYGPAKRWDPERFVESASGFARSSGLGVVVVGASEDREAAAAVADGVRRAGVRTASVAGMTQLPELVGILAGAAAVLTNDSGAMHLAAALGRPTVAIFGSTSPVWTSAAAPWVANLYAGYPCSPCYRRTCPIGYRCLRAIAPAEASSALVRLVG